VIHFSDLAVRVQRKLAILVLEAVDVHRSVRGLGSDKLVERIPRHTLHVVAVFSNLSYHDAWECLERGTCVALGEGCTCLGVVYARDVIHTTGNEEGAVGRPGQVVDLRAHGSTHVLNPPCLLVFGAVVAQLLHRRVLRGHPKEDDAIVAGGGQDLT
jgi:hypothetical protein